MHIKGWLIIATTVALPCGAALGQDAQPTPQLRTSAAANDDENRWVASGFVGSNFGNNAQSASVNYGGSVAYLWKNMYGAELDTGFTPSFQFQNNFFGTGGETRREHLHGERRVGKASW